jgi:hypothetical protein
MISRAMGVTPSMPKANANTLRASISNSVCYHAVIDTDL